MAELTARERDVLGEAGFSKEAIVTLRERAESGRFLGVLRFQAILGPLFVPAAVALVLVVAFLFRSVAPGVISEDLSFAVLIWSIWALVMFNLFFQLLRFGYWVADTKGSGWREVVQASRAASYGFVDHREYPKAQLAGFARSIQSEGGLDAGLSAEMNRIVRSRAILLGGYFAIHLAFIIAFVAIMILV